MWHDSVLSQSRLPFVSKKYFLAGKGRTKKVEDIQDRFITRGALNWHIQHISWSACMRKIGIKATRTYWFTHSLTSLNQTTIHSFSCLSCLTPERIAEATADIHPSPSSQSAHKKVPTRIHLVCDCCGEKQLEAANSTVHQYLILPQRIRSTSTLLLLKH